jgi:cytosine/adenosine deaminase-related metal-dependent hydrolase
VTGRLLLENAFVVSMDEAIGDVPGCDILVEDGRIAAVGRGLQAGDAERIDCTGCIAIPGFVDTHRHTWQTNVRGILPSCTLDEYLVTMRAQVGTQFRPEDVYLGNLLGCLEALNAGITTLLDWSHVSNTPDHSDEAVRGLRDSGIRGIYAHGVPVGADWWRRSERPHPDDARRIRSEHFSSDDQLLTFALAARAPGNTAFEVTRGDWALARELDARISVHVGNRITGVHARHVTDLYALDLLGPDITFIHCTECSEAELDLIAETGGTVSIASFIELLMGHGYPPTGRFLRRGVRPSLSIDTVTSAPGDMFTQMRTAYVTERITAFPDDPDVPFAPTLTPRDVLSFATLDGARAVGLDDRVGSLSPGKDADVVLIRTNMLNVAPVNDPIAGVVLYADTSNVDSVFVRGRALKRGGEMLGIDVGALLAAGESSRDYVLDRAGLLPRWAVDGVGAIG